MSIICIALFGSFARRDERPDSDLDILAVTDESGHRLKGDRHVKFTFASREAMIADAMVGDLIILHILKEAIFLYDPMEFREDLEARFKFLDNYNETKRNAADVGWFLCDFGLKLADGGFACRRAAWVVRTILVARSAEERSPVFAAAKLTKLDMSGVGGSIIEQKGDTRFTNTTSLRLATFLLENGFRRRVLGPTLDAYLEPIREVVESDESDVIPFAGA